MDPLSLHTVNSIHAEPSRKDKYGNAVPGRFDTGLLNVKNGGTSGVQGELNSTGARNSIFTFINLTGFCIGRIRCIFALPKEGIDRWFPGSFAHAHLAYVEWYTPFSRSAFEANSKMYRISLLMSNGTQKASITPISLITQSIHLFPKFGPVAPNAWKSSTVLNDISIFYVNPFSDRHQYATVF